jgi:hypothetical protein
MFDKIDSFLLSDMVFGSFNYDHTYIKPFQTYKPTSNYCVLEVILQIFPYRYIFQVSHLKKLFLHPYVECPNYDVLQRLTTFKLK